MATAVLDTSVVLASLQNEPGGDFATELIPTSLLLSVNLAEAAAKLAKDGLDRRALRAVLGALDCEVVPFDAGLAFDTGLLRPLTLKQGLSLGDRACLALALSRNLPAYTAERKWTELDLGIDIRLIR